MTDVIRGGDNDLAIQFPGGTLTLNESKDGSYWAKITVTPPASPHEAQTKAAGRVQQGSIGYAFPEGRSLKIDDIRNVQFVSLRIGTIS